MAADADLNPSVYEEFGSFYDAVMIAFIMDLLTRICSIDTVHLPFTSPDMNRTPLKLSEFLGNDGMVDDLLDLWHTDRPE
jgi:hypothetical protein